MNVHEFIEYRLEKTAMASPSEVIRANNLTKNLKKRGLLKKIKGFFDPEERGALEMARKIKQEDNLQKTINEAATKPRTAKNLAEAIGEEFTRGTIRSGRQNAIKRSERIRRADPRMKSFNKLTRD